MSSTPVPRKSSSDAAPSLARRLDVLVVSVPWPIAFSNMAGLEVMPFSPSSRSVRFRSPARMKLRLTKSSHGDCPNSSRLPDLVHRRSSGNAWRRLVSRMCQLPASAGELVAVTRFFEHALRRECRIFLHVGCRAPRRRKCACRSSRRRGRHSGPSPACCLLDGHARRRRPAAARCP